MESVVHFEITADDIERASEFYRKTFGWQIEEYPEMNYVILRTTKVDKKRMPLKTGAINGGMMKRSPKVKFPVITIGVKSMDASLKKIKANGGIVHIDKMAVGEMGFAAYIKDTEGNVIGLFEPTGRM